MKEEKHNEVILILKKLIINIKEEIIRFNILSLYIVNNFASE